MKIRIAGNKTCSLIIGAIFVYFFIVNTYTPVKGEDIFLIAFPKEYQVSNLVQLINGMRNSIANQMINWNVRLGEQLSIVFSCFDKVIFNLLNSACALLFFFLAYNFAFKRRFEYRLRETFYCLLFFSMIIVYQPALGEIFFWRTGSTNYLWSICILLSFCLPLRYYIGNVPIDVLGGGIEDLRLRYLL